MAATTRTMTDAPGTAPSGCRHILLALDGSPFAERALPHVCGLARRGAARLTLLRAIPSAPLPLPVPTAPCVAPGALPSPRELAEAEMRAAAGYLEDAAASLRTVGVEVEARVVPGPAADAIVEAAHEGMDLIAMTTHGRGGLGHLLFGSVANDVLRRARVPLLLVPPGAAPPAEPGHPQRIVVALDGSPLAERALRPADRLAASLDAEILLLRIVEPIPIGVETRAPMAAQRYLDAERAAAGAYLARVAANFPLAGARMATRVEVGPVQEGITRVAREVDAVCVAMATHGESGLTRLLLGSVASGVVRHADRPLLVVRPGVPGEGPVRPRPREWGPPAA